MPLARPQLQGDSLSRIFLHDRYSLSDGTRRAVLIKPAYSRRTERI